MNLYLIIYDISSLASNGFAVVAAKDLTTAITVLLSLGRFQNYNIIATLLLLNTEIPTILYNSVIDEGILAEQLLMKVGMQLVVLLLSCMLMYLMLKL